MKQTYEWLDAYCLGRPAAEKDYKEEWGVDRYQVGGKMFGMLGHDNEGRHILTLKCEPSFGQHLRATYPEIRPGYYMNKEHWNSVDLDGQVPSEVLRQMIDMSHELIVSSLSKKKQRELLGEEVTS
ncbi:MmcQ/YjbR family DNA-binding protein [Anoxynatronum buryatiense]|uniref:Predicted DNA-binding protein, MmcQ/YjbR family n=1 Tax=Anoxynatronum buryatiense TaxID=489973 RepID=A0AA45WXY6_9CLOT|nr:MmcQ/YjbR family DNA-binding protein [Anoxynatronum buryatiense]SMP66653.1 Predicted DNA-binding protein, MmcQ/YjbR family [Anoxynatronum buryatiense]